MISTLVKLACVSALSLSAFCNAQDRPTADDLLRWFPTGNYSCFMHCDADAIAAERIYPLYCELFGSFDAVRTFHVSSLPPDLKEGFESFTTATFAKVKGKGFGTLDDGGLRRMWAALEEEYSHDLNVSRQMMEVEDTSGNLRFFTSYAETRRAWVIRYPDLESRIAGALRQGHIIPVGRSILDRPLYRIGTNPEVEDGALLYATITGELLMAWGAWGIDAEPLLERMVLTGMGMEQDVLESEELSDLRAIVKELGHCWSIVPVHQENRQLLEQFQRVDAAPGPLRMVEKRIEEGLIYRILDFKLERDGIRDRDIAVFATEEGTAKGLRDGLTAHLPSNSWLGISRHQHGEMEQRRTMVGGASETTVNGTWIITTTFCSVDSLEEEKAFIEAARRGGRKSYRKIQ